jgi:vacuolar-type H+-ATPase subunit I/STV1
MEFLYNVIVVLHFLGLASLIGGFLVQIKSTDRVVNNAMWHGAWLQLITGLLLVGLAYPLNADVEDWEMDNAKIGVKLVILLAILALAWVNRKKESISTGVWGAIGGLAIANVIIAVFW